MVQSWKKHTTAVALVGPLSASIKATNDFFFYKYGVFFDPACERSIDLASKTINHAVLLVGYGTDPAGGDYWIIQNSWRTDWGENGFARMIRNSENNCHIASAVLYLKLTYYTAVLYPKKH